MIGLSNMSREAILRSARSPAWIRNHGSERAFLPASSTVMQSGKSVAEKIVNGAMEVIGAKKNALELVDPRRCGTTSPSVDQVDPPRRRRHLPGAGRSAFPRRMALAMRWLIESARHRALPQYRHHGAHRRR